VVELLRAEGAEIPVVIGGIIPPADIAPMKEAGVERVYTPKDFELNRIMAEIADLVAERNGVAQPA
jgi:(2R)-ethylmalonyl-CoA mutase